MEPSIPNLRVLKPFYGLIHYIAFNSMQTTPDIDQKRLILLHPDHSFLKQFKRNFPFNKIVLIRKDDPYVFALNEWPNYKILKYPFVIPFCILIIFLAII